MSETFEFDRTAILQRLSVRRASGQPIVSASAGIGLVAKSAEAAGVDLLTVQVTGRSRHLGIPTTTTLGNATQITMDTFPEIENVVRRTPVIGGIEATDAMRSRLDRTLRQYRELGFNGISNFPSVGATPTWAEMRRSVGEGIDREFDMIRLARQADVFTVAHVYAPAYAADFVEAGADVVVARCGPTAGGFSGPPEDTYSLAERIEHVAALTEAARGAAPAVIVLVHGGLFGAIEGLAALYATVPVDGVHGESAVERLPIEKHVGDWVSRFKQQTLRPAS